MAAPKRKDSERAADAVAEKQRRMQTEQDRRDQAHERGKPEAKQGRGDAPGGIPGAALACCDRNSRERNTSCDQPDVPA